MVKNTDTTNFSDELSQHVLEAWRVGHGGNPDEVHILIGDNSIALTIPKAMVQAEKVLFNNTTNTQVLDQYIRSVLEMIAEDLKPLIEGYTGREVQQVIPLLDLKAGWITAFYRFKDKAEDKNG
jgi:uncharacterized protein YbcI